MPDDPFDNQEGRERVNSAYKAQLVEDKCRWTFFDERLHMESVFSQRVNFILLLFPVLVTTFVLVDCPCDRFIVSFTGLIVLLVFYIPLIRTYLKLCLIQQITYKIEMGSSEYNNPIAFVQREFKRKKDEEDITDENHIKKKGKKTRRVSNYGSYSIIMIGIAFMVLCMFALLVYAIITMF